MKTLRLGIALFGLGLFGLGAVNCGTDGDGDGGGGDGGGGTGENQAGAGGDSEGGAGGSATGGKGGSGSGGKGGSGTGGSGTGGKGGSGTGGSGTGGMGTGGSGTGGSNMGGAGMGGAGMGGGGGTSAAPKFDPTIHAIFAAKCGTCHTTGTSGQHSIGSSDKNKAYMDSQKAGRQALCGGKKIGECALALIKSGEMPRGGANCDGDPAKDADKPACLTKAEQDAIDAWIKGGYPKM